jgi:hypothetical protein
MRQRRCGGREDGRAAKPRVSSFLRHEPGARAALDHMTEQPGPGHMVMAAARTPGRRRMGACETTPPASTGTTHTTLAIQYRDRPFPRPR